MNKIIDLMINGIVTADNKSIVGYRFDRVFALSFCWYTLLCT